jgi:metal-responsive CopG/Arc/MetJ family transcriptional regulator
MTAKAMVSFPETFLEEVDRVTSEEHRSRSELLREAMGLYIEVRKARSQPGSDPHVQGAVDVQDGLARSAPGSDEDSSVEIR